MSGFGRRPPRAFKPFIVEIGGTKYELHRDRGVPRVYRRTPKGSLVRVREVNVIGRVLREAHSNVVAARRRIAEHSARAPSTKKSKRPSLRWRLRRLAARIRAKFTRKPEASGAL